MQSAKCRLNGTCRSHFTKFAAWEEVIDKPSRDAIELNHYIRIGGGAKVCLKLNSSQRAVFAALAALSSASILML